MPGIWPASRWLWLVLLLLTRPLPAAGAMPNPLRQGEVRYEPPPGDEQVVPRFHLAEHTFTYELRLRAAPNERISSSSLTFPSAVKTACVANNTVHCELYLPQRPQPVPAVIVLHILGGDFPLARLFCVEFAERGVAALFLKMPYYGPRADAVGKRRMVSADAQQTVEGMTQAILDIRRATAWLTAQPEIDPAQLGIFGISLGGITAALAMTAEPRLSQGCLVLAGGDLGRVMLEADELAEVRRRWKVLGVDPLAFVETLSQVDPVRYAANVRGRRILMLNARQDEVVPKSATLALWEAFGEPPIVWYDGGHYSVARHIASAMDRAAEFFQPR